MFNINQTHIIISILLLVSITLNGQSIELNGGLNINQYFDFQKNEGYFNSKYNDDFGFNLCIGITRIKFRNAELYNTIDIFIDFDKYSGSIATQNGSLSYRSSTSAHITKNMLGLSVFLINNKFLSKKLRISFGPKFSLLLSDNIRGIQSITKHSFPFIETIELNDNTGNFSKKIRVSLNLAAGYLIQVSESIYIKPKYVFNLGLMKEFNQFEANTYSTIHNFQLGVIKDINRR